jgi:chemotaxis protein histidine kinase CheA
MTVQDDELLSKLRQQFLADPDDQVGQIESLANYFSENPKKTLQDMMRVTHNLKGAAQLAGILDFSEAVHQAEETFQALWKCDLNPDDLDTCLKLSRKLGTCIRRRFESTRDQKAFDHQDQANWESAILGLNLISSKSPKTQPEHNADSTAVVPKEMDDWGIPSVAPQNTHREQILVDDSRSNF